MSWSRKIVGYMLILNFIFLVAVEKEEIRLYFNTKSYRSSKVSTSFSQPISSDKSPDQLVRLGGVVER